MKRLPGLDLLKAIAMVMVISLHAGTWHVGFLENPSFSTLLEYAGRLFAIGVPVFVMVNGYLLFQKRTFDFKAHLWKTANVFFLLIAWSLILAILGSIINGTELTLWSIWELFINTKNGSKYTGVMWFMQALFALYLIFPLLKLIYDSRMVIFTYLFVVVCLFTVGMSLANTGAAIQIMIMPDHDFALEMVGWLERVNPIANGAFVLFFMLGGMIKNYESKLKKYRTAIIASGIVACGVSLIWCICVSLVTGVLVDPGMNYLSIFTPIILVGLFSLSSLYKGEHAYSLVRVIGSNTLGIYLLHMVFVWLVSPFFAGASFALRLVELALIFSLSFFASFLLSKIPGLRLLVTMRVIKR